jgi:hypothetical protein
VKWIVDRPRPDLARIASHAGSSFPSGHTATAAATYAALALVLGRGRSRPTKGGLGRSGGRDHRRRRREPCAARRALGDRRRRGNGDGLVVLRGVLGRVRRSGTAVRPSRRGGAAGCGPRGGCGRVGSRLRRNRAR